MRCPVKVSKNGYDERIERRGEKRKGKGKVERAVSRGRVVLAYKRLMGMCRWVGSHFHDWIIVPQYGVAFSIELLEWGRTFSDFLG